MYLGGHSPDRDRGEHGGIHVHPDRAGATLEVGVVHTGRTPPSPTPVSARHNESVHTPVVAAHAVPKTPQTIRHPQHDRAARVPGGQMTGQQCIHQHPDERGTAHVSAAAGGESPGRIPERDGQYRAVDRLVVTLE